MFEFKGTAAAESQSAGKKDDWRVVDHYKIQNLGKRPFTTMLAPAMPTPHHHQRALTEDIRRPSLTVRARSNSSMPSSTSYQNNLPPAVAIERSTPRSSSSLDRYSFAENSVHTRAERSESFGKSLMAKGSRLLRRQNSKNDLTSLHPMSWSENDNRHVQEMSNRPDSRHSRVRSTGEDSIARWNISEPFNFEHIMHTTPQKVQKIDELSHSDLIAEFSSLRSSQLGARSRELKGIKATEIQRGTFYSEAPGSEGSSPSPPQTGHRASPPTSPKRRKWQEEEARYDAPIMSTPSPTRSLRPAKSFDNFSQPSPRYQTAQTSPTSPPPRSSSRNAAPDFFTFHQESPTHIPSEPEIPLEGLESPDFPIAAWDDGVYDFDLPHAVTTPDDTAHAVRPPHFKMIKTELAGVPEEDEISVSEGKRSSTNTLIPRTPTPTAALRHAKSFPSAQITPPRPHRWSGALPQTSEVVGESCPSIGLGAFRFGPPSPEEHVEDVPVQPRFSRRISMRREESWEDDIDYCYEHEAEADCNFDWDRISTPEEFPEVPGLTVNSPAYSSPEQLIQPASATMPIKLSHSRSSSTYSTSPPLLLPLQSFLPELDPPSATSAESSFSSIPEAITPINAPDSSLSSHTALTKSWAEDTVPEWLTAADNRDSVAVQEELYQQIITGDFIPEQHQFPFSVGRVDGSTISNSPRSSRSPISKSSSQESFWYAQAARRQRNAGSVGSLPELMASKPSRERFDVGVEQLADHFATLAPAESSMDAASQRRRNSPSLAKDVALKSILAKAMSTDEHPRDAELPLHPALRDRAGSDAAFRSQNLDMAIIPPPPIGELNFARRVRSTSSASSLSQRGSRASYSLFPQMVAR